MDSHLAAWAQPYSFGNIGNALSGLATNVLGSTGMGTLLSSLPISSIGSALSVTGALPVLGEVMNGLGFTGAQNIVGGVTTLVSGVTSGSGLDLTSAFQGLSSVTDALDSVFPDLGLDGLDDFTALGSMAATLTSGDLTINNIMDVVDGTIAVTGFTPPAGVDQALNFALSATDAIDDGNGNTVAGLDLMSNAMDVVMGGLRDSISSVTDDQLADKMLELGLTSAYDALVEGEVNAGEMIGSFIADGSVSVEQVLDMAGVFMNSADLAVTAGAVAAATAQPEVFFEQFNREEYRPSAVTPRDTSDKAGAKPTPVSLKALTIGARNTTERSHRRNDMPAVARIGDISHHPGVLAAPVATDVITSDRPTAHVGTLHVCTRPFHGTTPIGSLVFGVLVGDLPIATVGSVAVCGAVVATGASDVEAG